MAKLIQLYERNNRRAEKKETTVWKGSTDSNSSEEKVETIAPFESLI